jgi:hypothetical protein
MPSQEKHESVPVGDECQTAGGFEATELPRYFYDASLLRRCMDMLQVDQSDLARDDPLLFRELQGMCALCRNKEECAQDLAHQFDDVRWDRWWVYCPNSAILTIIGAVQNCGRAAQHVKIPPSAALSHLR